MPVHEARLLEGKVLAVKIQEEIKSTVQNLKIKPRLVAVQVKHNSLNPEEAKHAASADWYIGAQEKMAQKLGIIYERFPVEADQHKLESVIRKLNEDPTCHGIFIAMPLPAGLDADRVLLALNPFKDLEGVSPSSLGLIVLRKGKLIPSTAYASLLLIEHAVKEAGKNLKGMKAVIVGQSAIVGRPLQLLLGERRVTTTVCNTGTTQQDLESAVAHADIVVGCAGQPGMIKAAWIKEGSIVIDVGTTEVNGKLTGDIEFEEAKKKASFITPVPGGVGPLTVTMLMQNLIHAYQLQTKI